MLAVGGGTDCLPGLVFSVLLSREGLERSQNLDLCPLVNQINLNFNYRVPVPSGLSADFVMAQKHRRDPLPSFFAKRYYQSLKAKGLPSFFDNIFFLCLPYLSSSLFSSLFSSLVVQQDGVWLSM